MNSKKLVTSGALEIIKANLPGGALAIHLEPKVSPKRQVAHRSAGVPIPN